MGPPPNDRRPALSRYLRDIRALPQLSRDEESGLVRKIAAGDGDAAARLIEANLSFVVKVAAEYRSLGVPYEDLLNEGNLGLIEAARRYDGGKGTRFLTYAVWWVRKKILEAIADHSLIVRVPSSRREKFREVKQAEATLASGLGRAPTREEIARHLSVRVAHVDRVRRLHLSHASLDQSVGDDDATSLIEFLADDVVSVEQRLLSEEARDLVARAFRRLPRREQAVLGWRLALGGHGPLTLNDVGRRLGLSRERVRQIENEAKRRLRRLLAASLGQRPWGRD